MDRAPFQESTSATDTNAVFLKLRRAQRGRTRYVLVSYMIGYLVPYVPPSTIMGRPSAASKTVGGRLRRPPTVLDSIVVDGATYGTIYPLMYDTST